MKKRMPVKIISWDDFHQIWIKRTERMPWLHHDDVGLTTSSCGKADLSRGCQACKDGGWVCFYPGFRCNANCAFCPQTQARKSREEETMGTGFVDRFLRFITEHAHQITGISLSGGETFLYTEINEQVLAYIQKHLPQMYVWAYTNGIAATPEAMKRFADLGLTELRFDLAATQFSPKIVQKVEDHAVKLFPWVTVEVPSLAETFHHLVERQLLDRLDAMGVKQLNLAQLCIPPDATTSPAYRNYLGSDHVFYRFESFKPGTGGDLYSVQSAMITYDIMDYAHERGLAIRINDCSSGAKEVQRISRHLNWGAELRRMKLHSYPSLDPPPHVEAPPAGVELTPAGVSTLVLDKGHGQQHPSIQDTVTVHYSGWQTDGLMFDSTVLRDEPMTVPLRNVIPGWADGVQLMVVGERRRFWIPETLAYKGQSGRPQGMLVFDIELLAIEP